MANNFLVKTLATFADANYQYTLELDDNLYIIQLKWNTRGEFWVVSLYTDDLVETIIEWRKLVLNVNLLSYSYNRYKPIGVLVATSNTVNQITFDNITQDIALQYITQL